MMYAKFDSHNNWINLDLGQNESFAGMCMHQKHKQQINKLYSY